MDTTRSEVLFDEAKSLIPAGVNSPVRAFGAVGGIPRFVASAAGSTFTDEDGNTYLDYCMSWGPLILGHAPAVVVEAVNAAAAKGLSYGAPHRGEIELARLMASTSGPIERVRFVSSGTEAVMSAVRIARGYTGRDVIVKFEGCYHGHVDALLVNAGSGLATFGAPSSAGIPAGTTDQTLVLPLDDEEALEHAFHRQGSKIAAVIIEPIPANSGLLLQRPEYLRKIRELTTEHGALLIFDEVISGFRVGPGGAAGKYGICPDLLTFGKVIGSGMPVGAFGGRRDVMETVAPLGPVYQAGTLSGNPVAMAAGAAGLHAILDDDHFFERLEALGARLEAGVNEIVERRVLPLTFVREGSIFWLAFQRPPAPRAFSEIDAEGVGRYAVFHREMMERGVYLAPSGYEVGFLSAAHTDDDIDRTVAAMDEALAAAFAHAPSAG